MDYAQLLLFAKGLGVVMLVPGVIILIAYLTKDVSHVADNPTKAPPCAHTDTYFDPEGWPTGEDLEVCRQCGASRTHWEQGESRWQQCDHRALRMEIQQHLDSLTADDRR